MTAALDVLDLARRYRIEMVPAGDRIQLRAPAPPPPEVVERLRAHKADILALLTPAGADPREWDDAAEAVAWFMQSAPPAAPFELRPAVTVIRPAMFWRSMRSDILAGPGVGRDHVGAVRRDVMRLYALFGDEA